LKIPNVNRSIEASGDHSSFIKLQAAHQPLVEPQSVQGRLFRHVPDLDSLVAGPAYHSIVAELHC